MTVDRAPTRGRWLGIVAVLAVLVLLLVLVLGDRVEPDEEGGATATPASSPSPPPLPGPEVLASPTAAAGVGAAVLLEAANRVLANGPLAAGWPITDERPVYVVNVTIRNERRLVLGDAVIATRLAEATDRLTLRFLPAATALGVDPPFISGSVDGVDATVTMDQAAALLHVDLGRERAAGEPVLLRFSFRYALVDAAGLRGDGPVGYGLLAHDREVTVLSHWLPLLTFDAAPLLATGDVGAFPVAIWAIEVAHPGVLVSGGLEVACRVSLDGCTRIEGAGLRDVSMLVMDEGDVQAATTRGHEIRVVHRPSVTAADAATVLAETVASIEFLVDVLGDLAWPQTDVVGTPLSRGAAGMEYPGMFVLRDDLWDSHDGAFGSYVIAHEAAHQWFHALVGNSSLADPVVDEAIAQYLSIRIFEELFGADAAADLVASMRTRYENAVAAGLRADPPAQPLASFESDAAYGAIVYGRAPLVFIEAEQALGRDLVVDFLASLVRDHGVQELTAAMVRDRAASVDARFGELLVRWWFDGTHL